MKKSYFFYLVLASLFSWGLADARTNPETTVWEPIITDQGGPDAYGYRWIDNDSAGGPAYNWIDITGYGSQVLGLGDDNNIGPIPIGFDFPYYWYAVNHCWIGSNGYIEFLNNYNYAHPFANIPMASPPNDYLACLTGDLDFSRGSGSCYYYSNNADTFIVSWLNVSEYLPNIGIVDSVHTFQLILSARDSSITYQYGEQHGTFTGGGGSDVIGIENVNGQVGIQYLRTNAPSNHMYHDGLALRFHPIPDPLFVVHDVGVLNAFQDGSGANFIPNNQGYTVRAEVKNFGNRSEGSIRSSCVIKRGTTIVYHDTIDVPSLTPSQAAWMTFPDQFTPDVAPQTYKVTFASIMTPDANATNDTLVAELDSYVLPQTMRYDDNVGETYRSWTGDFSGFALEFQVPDAVKLDTASVNIGAVTSAGDCYIWVLPDDGTGHPDANNILAGDTINVTTTGWFSIDFTAANLQFDANAKFWIVEVHALQSTISFGMDQTAPLSNRGWEFTGGYAPDRDRSVSDIMIKAVCEPSSEPPFQTEMLQLDLRGNFEPRILNSIWGRAQVTVAPPPESLLYINMVADSASSGVDKWIVRNLPIIPFYVDPVPHTFKFTFDLSTLGGITGTPFGDMVFGITSSLAPLPSMPQPAAWYTVPVGDAVFDAEGRPGGPHSDFGVPADLSGLDFSNPTPLGFAWHSDVPNVECGPNECAPASAANSFSWLADTYGLQGVPPVGELLDSLKNGGHMGTDPQTGTTDHNMLAGKLRLINEFGLPLEVHFQDDGLGGGDVVTPDGTARGQGTTPTFAWIVDQLDQGQDVELGMTWSGGGGHWVTLQGKIDFGPGAMGIWYRSDHEQGTSGGTDSTDFSWLGTDGNGFLKLLNESDNYVDITVAESPTGTGFDYILGDINGNGVANGVDVSYGVNYFKGFGDAPPFQADCPGHGLLYAAGDVNANCQFNGVDITYFVNFLKGLGPALTPCPDCPPNAVASPAPPLEPIGAPVLKSKGRTKVEN